MIYVLLHTVSGIGTVRLASTPYTQTLQSMESLVRFQMDVEASEAATIRELLRGHIMD
jgi:hypothetical protein